MFIPSSKHHPRECSFPFSFNYFCTLEMQNCSVWIVFIFKIVLHWLVFTKHLAFKTYNWYTWDVYWKVYKEIFIGLLLSVTWIISHQRGKLTICSGFSWKFMQLSCSPRTETQKAPAVFWFLFHAQRLLPSLLAPPFFILYNKKPREDSRIFSKLCSM